MDGLVTLGYEGRTAEELVALICDLKVGLLVDVRLTPLSRKSGLSKSGLAAALSAAGVEYRHVPALGNPRDNRAGIRSGDERSRQRFRTRLADAEACTALHQIAAQATRCRVGLLCYERDVDRCHRAVVAEELIGVSPGLAVIHV
jgi:uncharacterized protein (DUF488 family)